MSAAEGLKAAVRQRLEGVLVEVLGLIQTTMEKYESELKQSREEVERLTGPRTLRLRTEMTELTELTSESENERNEIYIVTSIKKEQPERPTARKSFPHNQNHENPTSNHNLKSEDSEEECPICRSLDQERNDSALINAEDSPASIQPQETEKTAVKSEEEERGLSDTNKPHQDLNEQEKREEGRHLPTASQDKTNGRISSTNSETTGGSSLENDLAMNKANINATTQKDPIISDGQKDAEKSSGGNSAEKALSSLEGKSSEGNDGLVGARKMDGTCRDQERLKEGSNSQKAVKRKATDQDQEIASKSRKDCSKSVDCEKVATEREYQKEANLVVHSSLSNSAEKGLSTREEIGKSRSLDPKSHGSKSLNVEDRVQDMVRNLPTVRLIPLEFFNKTQRSKVQLKKPTSSNTKLSQKQDGVQNSESSQKSKITKMKDKSKTVAGRSSDFLKSPTQSSSSKKPAQKEHGKKCSDDLLRKEQKQKKALNAEQARVGLVGSSVTNHSQYKSQESGKSKVDGVSQTTQMPTVLQSSPVTKEHKAKSLKLNSNRGTNSPLEKTGKEIDHSCKAGETSQNVSDRGASVTNGTIKDLAKSVQKTQLKSKAEHECSQCGTIFRLKGNLLKHLVMHQEERPFECSQCGSRFKRKTTLKEHMSIHSDEKQFKCSVCPRTYTRKSNLSDHMKTHLEHARPFSCYMCSRAFTCRSNLRRHIIAHSGLRPFRCDMCGKSFGRKSILQDHVRSHTREKHFKCLICNMKFTTKTIHQRHTRLHDNKRKFRCTVCTAAFNQNGHLRQHMLRHTGEKPYRCSVCEKTFTRKAYLKTHCQKYCHRPAHPVDLSDKQEPEAAH